jgi:predicted Zn-dependent protease
MVLIPFIGASTLLQNFYNKKRVSVDSKKKSRVVYNYMVEYTSMPLLHPHFTSCDLFGPVFYFRFYLKEWSGRENIPSGQRNFL